MGVSNQKTISYDLASMGAHAPLFPGSDLFSIIDISNTASYFDVGPDGIIFLGDHSEINGFEEQVVYSLGSYEMLSFPFTYGDASSASFSGTYSNSFNQTYNRNGGRTTSCQGYGTLILPYGIIDNVLKVTSVTAYNETGTGVNRIIRDTTYSFYDARNRVPVAEYYAKYTDGNLSLLTFSYLDQGSINVGIEDVLSTSVIVYPNPAQNRLSVDADVFIESIEVYSTAGQLLLHVANPIEHNVLDLSDFSPGLYLVQVNMGKESITKEVIVQ